MLQTTLQMSKISIKDKALFDNYLQIANLQVSELSFTNFFMWRNYYNFEFCIIDDFLCIISKMQENKYFCFFPVGDYSKTETLKSTIYQLKEYFEYMDMELVFSRVASQQIDLLNDLEINFKVSEDRANFDYVYSVQSLSTLAGKKLDGKRNHINKFKKLYMYEYQIINEENISDCKNIIDNWCKQKNLHSQNNLEGERNANIDLLNNYNELALKGAIIKVNGKPEAFTVGEKLNTDTVVIHVEKANSEIHGLYPLINQQFLANEWSNISYVNREQDMGLDGLRKAKMSYNPVKFIEKYIVQIA